MKIFTNRNLLIFLLLLLLFLRLDFFLGSAELLFIYIRLLVSEPGFAFSRMNFQLADTLLSFILISAALLILFTLKLKFLKSQISFRSLVAAVLALFFFFAPAISIFHPEFHKNLSVTKLLPPFSSVIMKSNQIEEEQSEIKEKFLSKKAAVVKESVNKNVIFTSVDRDFRKTDGEDIFTKGTSEKIIFIFGTDQYGRDIFSRLVYGARISLFVGAGAVMISFILGFVLGFAAGYPGGIIDIILNRTADIFLSFPVIFLIILILALFGNSLFTVIIVLGFSGWMGMFKIVRGEVIGIKKKDYFISGRLAGLSFIQLMFRETLPVIAVPIVVNLIFQFANVILAEAALSYLGLGAGGNYSSWGSMIQASQGYLSKAWWMIIAPGFLLVITLFTAYETGKNYNQKVLRRAYD